MKIHVETDEQYKERVFGINKDILKQVRKFCEDEVNYNQDHPYQKVHDVVDSGIFEGRLEFAKAILIKMGLL